MATAVPGVILGLVAGVVVDRYDRCRIMIVAEVARAALVCLIPLLAPLHVAWLYALVMLSSAVGQFFDPAHESVLPEVTSEEDLAVANSLMAISSFGATAIGFAASGLIASQANIMRAFYANGLTFLFSGLCILLLRFRGRSAGSGEAEPPGVCGGAQPGRGDALPGGHARAAFAATDGHPHHALIRPHQHAVVALCPARAQGHRVRVRPAGGAHFVGLWQAAW